MSAHGHERQRCPSCGRLGWTDDTGNPSPCPCGWAPDAEPDAEPSRSITLDYFAIEAVNWSSLKVLDESPKHYRHALAVKRADTAALSFGRLVHLLTFEPELFDLEFAIAPDVDKRTKAGKEAHADWLELLAGRTETTTKDVETAQAMARAVRTDPNVLPYLEGGVFESVLLWTDEATGLRCKAKPDWLVPRRRTLIDLKTTQSVRAPVFGASAARYGYHGQLAHYAAGIEAVHGWTPDEVLIVAVEKTAPYDVAVFVLDSDEALYMGQVLRDELMTKLRACIDSDYWPGRHPTPTPLRLPAWADRTPDDDAGATITFDEG